MTVRTVIRMGDPRLRRVAEPVGELDTRALHALVEDMMDTMEAYNGAGLAAPQIGVPLRVVIFGVEANPRYPDVEPVPFTVLVNPRLEPLDDQLEQGWEGCLSVPGMRGLVPRYRRIRYTGWDASGREIERVAEGFHARVVQHECDHLDGVLYVDRITDKASFGFIEELQASGALAPAVAAD
ncbi:MAG TPA: peptide deformylase [Gammaproteobacteria bacterium]